VTAPVKAPASAITEALVKSHTSGWEAWKAKDAKKLTEITTSTLSVVDPLGNWHSGQANVVKRWTETMKCEGINNVKVSDGFASGLSPTVEILTLKGTADGTCDGQKNGTLNQTAIYVKEGDTWKLAFMFESPAM
jgi:ketosteroid isomerase-like protein